MKIIDKYKDYYDFYQNVYKDDTFTFDRRDSYDLQKQEFASNFSLNTSTYRLYKNMRQDSGERPLLLQVGVHFWFIKLTITETNNNNIYRIYTNSNNICIDYTLEVLAEWENYNCKRKLIKLMKLETDLLDTHDFKRTIESTRNNQYKVKYTFDHFYLCKDNKTEIRHIPILKNIGIPTIIEPLNIYLALEQYFALEKQEIERTESIGLTDKEKITNHGFDLKASFRGK